MTEAAKDTIYIDIDDEITAIIDKLRSSNGKIVALVLPKRASVFQSVVNMRLLKRAADDAKKHLVLITSESGLMPLAGMAGIHVAKTLTSKPEIPTAPTADDAEETVQEEASELGEGDEIDLRSVGNKPVGELAGAVAVADGVETLELDDDTAEADGMVVDKKDFTPAAVKHDKKLRVPNFERFRVLTILAAVAFVLLIIGGIFALKVMPKAVISITTDATNVPVSLNLNLSTSATKVDADTSTLPAKVVKQQKTYTQQATASGTKNLGEKATGKVKLTAKKCSGSPFDPPDSLAAGTGVSTGGQTYIIQSKATFTVVGASSSNGCYLYPTTAGNIDITAQSGGSSYNAPANSNFTTAGRSDVTGTGSASGGTDNNVQVVSQADIDAAKGKISTSDSTIKQALQNQLVQDGYYAFGPTFSSGTPEVTSDVKAGDQASTVTVTEIVTYTMLGSRESDLKTLVDDHVKTQIDTKKQSILSEGLAAAKVNAVSSSDTAAQLTFQVTAIAGPDLDQNALKAQVMGKKAGEIRSLLKSNPGVTDVDVKLSPFWVSSVPKKPSKVTVTIEKPKVTIKNTNDANP